MKYKLSKDYFGNMESVVKDDYLAIPFDPV